MDNKKKANYIAKVARNSISDYCINICKSKCCKREKLVLFNDLEVNAIVGSKKDEYLSKKVLEKNEVTQNYYYDLEKKPCRNLTNDNLCLIHKDKNKPTICDDYPIFLTNRAVILAPDCDAAINGLLDNYICEIKKLGYKKI